MSDKDYTITVHPGSLPDDMTQEELDELMATVEAKIADGTFFTEAEEADMDQLRSDDPELYERLMSAIEDNYGGNTH